MAETRAFNRRCFGRGEENQKVEIGNESRLHALVQVTERRNERSWVIGPEFPVVCRCHPLAFAGSQSTEFEWPTKRKASGCAFRSCNASLEDFLESPRRLEFTWKFLEACNKLRPV